MPRCPYIYKEGCGKVNGFFWKREKKKSGDGLLVIIYYFPWQLTKLNCTHKYNGWFFNTVLQKSTSLPTYQMAYSQIQLQLFSAILTLFNFGLTCEKAQVIELLSRCYKFSWFCVYILLIN